LAGVVRTTQLKEHLVLAPALLAVSTLIAGAWLPDPAPYGQQRPYEPDVAGPKNLDRLDVTVTRNDASSGKGVTVAYDRHSRTAEGVTPAAARRFVFLFDKSISLNNKDFPTCASAVVREQGPDACPADSQVGGGTSTNLQGQTTPVYLLNTQYANGDYGLIVSIPAAGVLLEQTLEQAATPYRPAYKLAIDEIIPVSSTPPQQRAGTSRFELSFGATRTITNPDGTTRTVSLVESTAPAHGRLNFSLWSHFVTGQTVLPTDNPTITD